MSRISDMFAQQSEESKKEDPSFVVVDISVSCPVCDQEADNVFYNKSKKKVTTVCEEHEATFDMDLSWMVI